MNGDEQDPREDEFASLLAAFDEALAQGFAGAAARQEQAPQELRERFARGADCVRLLGQLWPAPAPTASGSSGPGRDTVVETGAPPTSPPGYELRDEIGRGGMGVVYRARDIALNRDVAVKLLSDRYPADSSAARRFLSEARITGQLQHPGIPAVHQVGTLANGRPFLAMKLIKGSTLEAILKQRPSPLPLSPAPGERDRSEGAAERGWLLAIFEAVCQAVGYAHAHRVIHRDLKPANVMVGAFGEVQVMDWGLAKALGQETPASAEAQSAAETLARTQFSITPETGSHTQAGSLVGTPAYIPPEQALCEIERVNERSDVFGLGALLAVILTGKPPYTGETAESVRVQAVRCKLEDCFARLDASGAEAELVALCKRCLAFEPADRPADAGAVAAAVAGLRAAADERARRAELERVRVEGEQATALARAAERRKRRRLVIGAAAVLALAALGGLTAVLAVQRQANAVQRQANLQLEAKNAELAEQQKEVEARFETAQQAIATFHTGVSEDFLLKNAEFKELRTKLLKEAAGFYSNLEKLLAGKTDAKSRQLLAEGYFQLGELTDKIGDKKEALAVQRKALALRRELAAAPGADVETRLEVARSLRAAAYLLQGTGDSAGALSAYQELRDLAAALEAESPTDAVRGQLAAGHHGIGYVLRETGKLAEALEEYQKGRDIRQKLAEANPAITAFQRDLAVSQNNIGLVLSRTGRRGEALKELQKARAIWRQLAEANPGVTEFSSELAWSHNNIGIELLEMGKPAEALHEYQKALAIRKQLADDHRAVTQFQSELAVSYNNIGNVLLGTGKPAEAAKEYQKMLDIMQKLVDANPATTQFQQFLCYAHANIAIVLSKTERPAEALTEYEKALAIMQKLADANPAVPDFQRQLAKLHNYIGQLHAREKRFREALAALDRELAISQKLADAHPTITEYTSGLGYSHASRGKTNVRAGHAAEAAADLRRALALWDHDKGPSLETRLERARALALLARLGGEAKSGVTGTEAAVFADQAVAALRAALEAGWSEYDELKEPDFDPLRGRDDFKKLLTEVEAKSGSEARPKN
jgi:serine/threonine protein kinase